MERLRAVSGRIAALSGAIAVILSATGASLGDPYNSGLSPDPSDSADAIATALVKIQDDVRLGVLLGSIGAFLLICFLGYLRSYLQSFEGPNGWLSSVAFGGGLVAVGLILVSHSVVLAATETAAYGQDPVLAKVFLTHGWNYFYVVSPPLMAVVAASSFVGLRFGALPRWLSIVGLLMLVVPFFAGAGLGAMVGLLWILITSVVLVVKGSGAGGLTVTTS
ncbi:MAG TPA: hypothetical protein VNA87_05115 [Actinomycetota bacterium]|nr:hypothetical protein [Actinomycetota bacterium]